MWYQGEISCIKEAWEILDQMFQFNFKTSQSLYLLCHCALDSKREICYTVLGLGNAIVSQTGLFFVSLCSVCEINTTQIFIINTVNDIKEKVIDIL